MAKRSTLVCTNFVCKNKHLNIVLSLISIIWIWRGVWSLTDMLLFEIGDFDMVHFFGYLIPLLAAFAYLYFNDYELAEISHETNTDYRQ